MKHPVLLSALLGVLLNLGLMLLPSVLLGVPRLVLVDRCLATFLLLISVWVILEAVASSDRMYIQGQPIQARWLPYFMSAVMLLGFLIALTEHTLNGSTSFTIFAAIGSVAMGVGMLLRYLAIRALGPYFLDEVIVVSGQPIVTRGIYNRLRHPSEAGNLCIAFGSSLLLASLIGLVIGLFLLLPIVLIRIRLEDRLLMRHDPNRFTAYARDVPALFPRFSTGTNE